MRYVLEGSLRKAGSRIRVTAQLVEAETGKHTWAGRYDRDLADIFAVQDEITEAVTTAVAPAIADAELRRALRKPPGSLDAWATYQRELWHLGKATAGDYELAKTFFRRAIDLDPNFGFVLLNAVRTPAVNCRSRDGTEGMAVAMKVLPVARKGTRWSDVNQIGDIYTASFTSVGGENCKAFLKLGPPWQSGWLWVVRGWLCGVPGNSVQDRDLQSFVDALVVKVP